MWQGSLQFQVTETLGNLSPTPEDVAEIQVETGEILLISRCFSHFLLAIRYSLVSQH